LKVKASKLDANGRTKLEGHNLHVRALEIETNKVRKWTEIRTNVSEIEVVKYAWYW
jgi:hypothetical protein